MRPPKPDYPTAVASYDAAGIDAAIAWCAQHTDVGGTITVWTSRKSDLRNCDKLERLVNTYRDVEHVTGRGGGGVYRRGAVLMAWPNMDDIAKLTGYSTHISGLCALTWNEDWIRPWVSTVGPDVLGDGTAWATHTPALDPVLEQALTQLTSMINHANSVGAGFEKDIVVSALMALRAAGVPLDADTMQGWVIANGWSGSNPQELASLVTAINSGTRPRHRNVLREDYVDHLRARVEQPDDPN